MSYFWQVAASHVLTGFFWGVGFWAVPAAYMFGRWSVARLREMV